MGYAKIPTRVALLGIGLVGFLMRASMHLFMVPRWIIEEVYNYSTVRDLVASGSSSQSGFYPMLEHQLIYATYLITRIDPIFLSQYANPFIGALTIIPLYYVLRFKLTQRQSLIGCLLWALSETAFYRSAYFGSTETLGFFLSLGALAIYQRRGALLALPLLALSVFAHLLPTAYITGVIALDLFLKAERREKLIILGASLIALVIFFSPFNPHQRLLQSLTSANLLGGLKLSNLSLYSTNELMTGVAIFGGFLCLGFEAFLDWTIQRKTELNYRLMEIMALVTGALFIFSWVDYQPNIFAPPRLTFYFLVPFIYYASTKLSYKKALLFGMVAILSASNGAPVMLFTDDAMTIEEFNFIDSMGVEVRGVSEWWTDYPIRNSVTLLVKGQPTIGVNDTLSQNLSYDFIDPQSTMKPNIGFKYVLLTPRMEENGLFLVYSGTRTIRVNKPVADIWASGENGWTLIREDKGIKLYKRIM